LARAWIAALELVLEFRVLEHLENPKQSHYETRRSAHDNCRASDEDFRTVDRRVGHFLRDPTKGGCRVSWAEWGRQNTTIKMLTTLLKPTSGTIELDGLNPERQPGEVRKRFGIVFQDSSLDDELFLPYF
jgi:hypothetical protein